MLLLFYTNSCNNDTPAAYIETSALKINGLVQSGVRSTGGLQINSFSLSNTYCCVSVHSICCEALSFVKSVNGRAMLAK